MACRTAPPAPPTCLRESYREGKKVRKRTLANLSALSDEQIDAIRAVLSGQSVRPVEELWQISARVLTARCKRCV